MPQTISEQRIPALMPTAVCEKIVEAPQYIGATRTTSQIFPSC
jgi:hypothetical protein